MEKYIVPSVGESLQRSLNVIYALPKQNKKETVK